MPELEEDLPPDPMCRQHPRRQDSLQHNRPREREPREVNHDIKLTPPTFAGKSNPEVYLDWERRLEYIFDCYGYSENKKVALATAQLTDHALAWWDRTVAERRRQVFGPIQTWRDMKYLLRLRYVPEHYHRDLQKRFRKLTQGTRSVEEYFEEFEKLLNSLELEETEEALMAQFVDGLQERIARKVERVKYSGLHLHLSVQVEQQIKRKASLTNRNRGSQPWQASSSRTIDKGKAMEVDSRLKSKSTEAPKTNRPEPGKFQNTSQARTRDITCFKCQGRGHYARDCPNQRVMIITPSGGYESQDEPEEEPGDNEENVEYLDTGEYLLVTRRVLSAQVQPEDRIQRENLFHTRCTINNKVCNIVIDGGSCTNVASKFMVDRLGLEKTKHPRPYKLQWLDDATELKVTEQVTVPFSVSKYKDEVLCDVVPMQAEHLLLGRQWQCDKATMHNGRTNFYSFTHLGRKYNLAPLSPTEVHELQSECNKRLRLKELELLPEVEALLKRFEDVFPEEIPPGLPPLRGIEHKIDLVPGQPLPNKAAYRMNPEESKELERQVRDLMDKGYIQESLSPFAVPVLLVPKKDGTWRMCVDCRAINNITIKYRHPIPRLDDILDELSGSTIFSKVDLKSGYH
ncbi:uncharacterized protein LOC112086510 [Eutrema salsugineum]|uniref:uncharacterized protein LOC112086510 n=1 Tax=Eutrema salsugineum TaxID=72664 RepID=UPI000CED170A|nr:uncharacterized protein LOC112086510 [Eutrema salsugineum]